MLQLLVESKQPSNFVLLEDTIVAKGDDLFTCFLNNHIRSNDVNEIHLFCYENPVTFYLKDDSRPKVIAYDCYTDPCGWHDEVNRLLPCSEYLKNDPENLSKRVIMLDSLCSLTCQLGFNTVYRDLFHLSKSVKKIICLVHCDMYPKDEILKFEFMASSVLKLMESPSELFRRNMRTYLVDVLHKKPGGKVHREKEVLYIDFNWHAIGTKFEGKKKEVRNPAGDLTAEMKNLTTFKLGLEMSNTEKLAKSNLVLPYLRKDDSNASKVIYVADAYDDLEEDPDDDLDI